MSDLLAAASSVPGLELELYSDTQWATAYLHGRPFLTLQRRRVYASGPLWQAFTTDGAKAFDSWSSPGAIRRAERLALAQPGMSDPEGCAGRADPRHQGRHCVCRY